jgi:epoxyqueuosine reductase
VIPHLKEELKRAALGLGFDLAGVAGVADTPEHQFFPEWIEEGRAGEMKYLEARNEANQLKRAALSNAAPWARSVVVCALNYNSDQPYSSLSGSPSQGWIARYAWAQRDYHDVILPKLRALESKLMELCSQHDVPAPRTWCYVDTGPVIERIFAKYAGIGWIGKNTCVLNQQLGSWLFLGVMLTSLELTPDLPPADHCGSCTRCLDACPTNAFTAPYAMDASKCIAYLTIELRDAVPEELRPGIGRQIFGCDICQDVCPWNRYAPATSLPELQPRPELVNPGLAHLARLTPDEFREMFRGSPVKRAKLSGLRRNAVIAMANSGDESFLPLLQQLCSDEDAVVATHARWGAKQLLSLTQASPENDGLQASP